MKSREGSMQGWRPETDRGFSTRLPRSTEGVFFLLSRVSPASFGSFLSPSSFMGLSGEPLHAPLELYKVRRHGRTGTGGPHYPPGWGKTGEVHQPQVWDLTGQLA